MGFQKDSSYLDELSQEEIKLAAQLGFDLAVVQHLKQHSQNAIKQLQAFREEKKQINALTIEVRVVPYKYKGISIDIIGRKQAREVVNQLKVDLEKKGYLPFYTQRGNRHECEIGVIKTSDHYQLFNIKPTSATNYGLTTRDIIIKLKEWEQECFFRIYFIDFDSLELIFERLPTNLTGFARQVKHFCPDIVEQGTGNTEDLEKIIQASKSLLLWWD